MIPRLPESANSLDITITINKRLRPYFEIWYQRKKESGEAPEQFALRFLKLAALNDYVGSNVKTEADAIESATAAAKTALQDDIVFPT